MRQNLKSYFSRLFAGDLGAFGGPSTEEAVAGQIRAEIATDAGRVRTPTNDRRDNVLRTRGRAQR